MANSLGRAHSRQHNPATMPQLPSFVGGGDSLYCEASHSADEVLCYGSDDEHYESPEVRISCLEEQARRFLEGRRPFLLSASLRGPFDNASWQNPWRGRSSTAYSSNDTTSHPQRLRPSSAQDAPQPTPAPTLELGTTPEDTMYAEDRPPVSKKRTAGADWLRRTNLKRMRSHDFASTPSASPTLRRGRSADYTRSISVPIETHEEMHVEAFLPGRRSTVASNAEKVKEAGSRNRSADKLQRLVPPTTARPMSVPANVQRPDAQQSSSQCNPCPSQVVEDVIVDAEVQQQDGDVRQKQQQVKAEEEDDSDVFMTADENDSTSDINTEDVKTEAEPVEDCVSNSAISATLQEPSLTFDEDHADEASQQLLGELNETDKDNETDETANIKAEAETEQPALQTRPCLVSVGPELVPMPSLGTGIDAVNSAEDTTGITSSPKTQGLVTGEAEKCDNATLPETAISRASLEKEEQTFEAADASATTSQNKPLDVRSWAYIVGASVFSSLTNLPTSPCSPEHTQAAALNKTLVEQVPQLAPALPPVLPSSGAPPSTPDTKQSSLPTPDMSVSIRSFRHFRSPTPTPPPRRRPNKPGQPRSILSYPRRSGGFSGPARHNRRVQFALPDDAASNGIPFTYTYDVPDANVEGGEGAAKRSHGQGQYGSARTASPPPRDGALIGTLPSEVEKFQEHFASVANRSKQAAHGADSSEHGPGTASPLQEQRTIGQSQAAERPANKPLDEVAGGVDKENQANDWEFRHGGDGDEEDEQPVDDVQEVLDNLDDFLGMWSMEAELAQTRSEHS